MEITAIKQYPVFLQKYIESDTELSHMLDKFKNFIVNKETTSIQMLNNNIFLEYYLDESDFNIRYLVNYYLEKSSLDNKYECKYEMDLGIPKSISNEVFIITLNINNHTQDDVNLVINSYEKNKLVLKCI